MGARRWSLPAPSSSRARRCATRTPSHDHAPPRIPFHCQARQNHRRSHRVLFPVAVCTWRPACGTMRTSTCAPLGAVLLLLAAVATTRYVRRPLLPHSRELRSDGTAVNQAPHHTARGRTRSGAAPGLPSTQAGFWPNPTYTQPDPMRPGWALRPSAALHRQPHHTRASEMGFAWHGDTLSAPRSAARFARHTHRLAASPCLRGSPPMPCKLALSFACVSRRYRPANCVATPR